MKKKITFFVLVLSLVFLYLYWLNTKQIEGGNIFMEEYKRQSQEKYDEIYDANHEKDYQIIVQEEEIKKMDAIKKRDNELIVDYWRRAKSEVGQKIGAITQEFPEIYADLVVKDVKAGDYNNLSEYLSDNYPDSRLVSLNIESLCKEYGATKEQCATMLAVSGVESAFDTNYVTHFRERDVEGGRARNNMWGLKMNRRYAGLKGLDYVTKAPYDNYSFVDFNSLDSGIKFFIEFLNIEYKGASQPSHLFPNFNSSQTWLTKANRFYDIILPLIKY